MRVAYRQAAGPPKGASVCLTRLSLQELCACEQARQGGWSPARPSETRLRYRVEDGVRVQRSKGALSHHHIPLLSLSLSTETPDAERYMEIKVLASKIRYAPRVVSLHTYSCAGWCAVSHATTRYNRFQIQSRSRRCEPEVDQPDLLLTFGRGTARSPVGQGRVERVFPCESKSPGLTLGVRWKVPGIQVQGVAFCR